MRKIRRDALRPSHFGYFFCPTLAPRKKRVSQRDTVRAYLDRIRTLPADYRAKLRAGLGCRFHLRRAVSPFLHSGPKARGQPALVRQRVLTGNAGNQSTRDDASNEDTQN